MDTLRARVTYLIVGAFLLLLGADAVDGLLLEDKWSGCPKELYPIVGAIVAGLFTAEMLRQRRNGNGKSEGGKGG